jgi:acyl-coenzyme A synthetase/AMP-(fatty) acid ligase
MLANPERDGNAKLDGWIVTPDLAERRGDRIMITGRMDDVINVGGSKVSPSTVEDVVAAFPGVADCVAYGQRNAITGAVVACDVLGRAGATLEPLEIRAWCAERLPPASQPRVIRIVDAIKTTAAGKKRA